MCCWSLLIGHSVNSLEVCLCSYKANLSVDSTVQIFSLSFIMIAIQSAAQTHRKFESTPYEKYPNSRMFALCSSTMLKLSLS
jgi:hypothetical protein